MQNPASGIGLAYLRKGRGWAGGQTTVSTGENSRDKARRSWAGVGWCPVHTELERLSLYSEWESFEGQCHYPTFSLTGYGWGRLGTVCTVLSRFSWVWLCDPMDCSPPGSSVPGILQARILEWVAMPSSRESSWPRDQTCLLPCRQILYHWAPGKA